jgi:hypothetical protein
MKVLLTADWHIRGDRPRCRVDEDWIDSQRQDIAAVRKIADVNNVDEMWILGDLFHQPRCATEAVVMVLDELKKFDCQVRILPGNHDLPFHDYQNLDKCSLGVILKSYPELVSREVEVFPGEGYGVAAYPFGRDPTWPVCDVWATHRLVFEDEEARPMKDVGQTAQELLDAFTDVREMIVTGDYHHGYVHTGPDNRRVVTPGCLNIQVADMADYRPRVYIWDVIDSSISLEYIGKEPAANVVTDYLEVEKMRDDRIEKVLQVVGSSEGVSLSFMDNLEKELATGDYPNASGVFSELKDTMNKDRQ